jgi:hypothetical protein
VVVGLLRGSFVFIADLVREIDLPVEVDFLEAQLLRRRDASSSREVRILKDLRGEIAGRDVLVVEDIVDTGFTLHHVVNLLQARASPSGSRSARCWTSRRAARWTSRRPGRVRDPRRVRRGLRHRLRPAQPQPALHRQGAVHRTALPEPGGGERGQRHEAVGAGGEALSLRLVPQPGGGDGAGQDPDSTQPGRVRPVGRA